MSEMKLIMENWRGYLNEDELRFNSEVINEAIIKSGFFNEEELLSESLGLSSIIQKVYEKVVVYAADIRMGTGIMKADITDLAKKGLFKLKGKALLFVLKGFDLIVRLANVKRKTGSFQFKDVFASLKKCGVAGSKYFCRSLNALYNIIKSRADESLAQIVGAGESEEETRDPAEMETQDSYGSTATSAQVRGILGKIFDEVQEAIVLIKTVFKLANAAQDPDGFAQDLQGDLVDSTFEFSPEGA